MMCHKGADGCIASARWGMVDYALFVVAVVDVPYIDILFEPCDRRFPRIPRN